MMIIAVLIFVIGSLGIKLFLEKIENLIMKRIASIIIIFFAFSSFIPSGNRTTYEPVNKDLAYIQNKQTSPQHNRKKLLQELQKMKIAFKAKEKKGISKFFKFPLDDSAIQVYGIDSKADLEVQDNRGRLGEKTFEKYFSRFYQYYQMEQFNKLFQNLNTYSLLKKDKAKCEKHYKNSGCYYTYEVSIEGDEITLLYATNSDEDYIEKHPNESIVCAEHTWEWVFIFDGQKLYFKKLFEAG